MVKIHFDLLIEQTGTQEELNNELKAAGLTLEEFITIARFNLAKQLNALSTNEAVFKVTNGKIEFEEDSAQ